jgi:hypothetical protein
MLSPIMQYSLTNKAKDLNLVEKFVGMFGGKVEVGAFWGGGYSVCQVPRVKRWWGYRFHLTQCAIDNINYYGTNILAGMGISSAICSWACSLLSFYITLHMSHINWLNSKCRGDGVYAGIDWLGKIFYWEVC